MTTILDFLPKLRKALALTGTHGVADVADRIRTGEAQLWVRDDGMIVTEVEDTPTGRVLRFWLAAGSLPDVLALADECYEWGREMGCTRATILGRKGWTRPLADHGWSQHPKLVYFTKDLTE